MAFQRPSALLGIMQFKELRIKLPASLSHTAQFILAQHAHDTAACQMKCPLLYASP
jgi:hypothetical protein